MNSLVCVEETKETYTVHYHLDKKSEKFESEEDAYKFLQEKYAEGYRHMQIVIKKQYLKRTLFGY